MLDTREEKLNSLLRQWQERFLEGETLSAEELCQASPELIEDLRQRIRARTTLDNLELGSTAQEAPTSRERTGAVRQWPRLEGYEVLEVLGQGGMGIVFKARQVRAERIVALKMIRNPGLSPRQDVERFRREVRALASIQHPNIVPIYHVDEQDGEPYFTMEYLSGGNLHAKIAGRPQDARESAALVEVLARAVEAAHQAGVIHRDLKPSNVLLAADGTPRIADFGLAKPLAGDALETPSGAILGTPCYTAPEQASGRGEAGVYSDVYSLGAILYECLTGRPPFKRETAADTIVDVLTRLVTPPRQVERSVPRGLEAICLKCLNKDPSQRYSSAGALADDLGRWPRGEPLQARLPRWPVRVGLALRSHRFLTLTAGAAILALLGVWLWLGLSDPDRPVKRLQRSLSRGDPITLIPAQGRPLWLHWPFGEAGLPRSTPDAKGFALETYGVSLGCLLPSVPREHFLVEAEVLHHQGAPISEVGLFLGLRPLAVQDGEANLFCVWSFNDKVRTSQGGNQPELNFLLCHDFYKAQGGVGKVFRRGGGRSVSFEPSGVGREPQWRRIALECTAAGISPYWEGARVKTLSWLEVQQRVQGLLEHIPELKGQVIPFEVKGGLGLYLDHSAATFKNVVVKPR